MTELLDGHDAVLFDLDGTLFRGTTVLPSAREVLAEITRRELGIGYLTNNGSRSPDEVVAHLGELGFAADPAEVVTSGQAAAGLLAERLAAGSPVLVVGTDSLAGEVTSAGLRAVTTAGPGVAVVQGHSPDTGWRELAEACLVIRAGGLWVTCNVDATLPDERGLLPGNGAMVAALRLATGASPMIAGKPEPTMFNEAVRRVGARHALVVGDRLDTDIAGANRAGLPSLLVLTGVSDAAELLCADAALRPTYLGADLSALWLDAELARPAGQPPWTAEVTDGELTLGTGSVADEPIDPIGALRTLCHVHWARGGGEIRVRALDEPAERALKSLGLRAGGEPRVSPVD